MADLADFFAKKDKKKTKPKKFVPEEMAQKLEEAEKKEQERERREEMKREHLREEQLEIDDPNHKKEPAEEWTDEVEQEVDLSGLNIQQLDKSEPEQPASEAAAAEAEAAAAAMPVGPWRKINSAADETSAESEPSSAPAAEPVTAADAAAAAPSAAGGSSGGTTGVYVPVHRRNQPAEPSGALQPIRPGGRGSWRNKAPDISSNDMFPTLGAAVEEPTRGAWSQRPGRMPVEPFQQVRHGTSSSQDKRLQTPKLSLGNQFDALQMNDAC